MHLSQYQLTVCLTSLVPIVCLLVDRYLITRRPKGWHEAAIIVSGATVFSIWPLFLYIMLMFTLNSQNTIQLLLGVAYVACGAIVWWQMMFHEVAR